MPFEHVRNDQKAEVYVDAYKRAFADEAIFAINFFVPDPPIVIGYSIFEQLQKVADPKMDHLSDRLWTVEIGEDWEVCECEECVSFSRSNGVGAVQVSSYVQDSSVSHADLCDIASDHINAGAMTRDVILGDFSGITFRYFEDGTAWRQWYLRSGQLMLYVTYNCDIEHDRKEDFEVESLLETLRIKKLS